MADNIDFIVSKYKKSKYSIIRKKQTLTPYLSVITEIQKKYLKRIPISHI
jgi:hypothetical protein